MVGKAMAEHYNKVSMKQRRKALRHSMPKAKVTLWKFFSENRCMEKCRTPYVPLLRRGSKNGELIKPIYLSPSEKGREEGLGIVMTRIFTKKNLQERRRYLRHNMPKAEVILWSKLKSRQMHGKRFLRQYSVDRYIVDFYCPRLKLAIEVDGDSHYKKDAEEYDAIRQQYIESFGIRFFRCTNTDVLTNIDGVCEYIFSEIEKMIQKDMS